VYRTVLALHDVDGVPMRRIAEAQGVPLFTAYTRLRKARRDFAAAVRQEVARPPRRALLPGLKIALPVAVVAAVAVWTVPVRHHPAATTAVPLDRGLQAYWRFDEQAGMIVHDQSGRGGDCVLRAADPAKVWGPGRLGGAAELGGRDFLECRQPALAEAAAGELTVATWVLVREIPTTGNRAIITRQLGGGREDHFFLGFANGRLVFNSHSWNTVLFFRMTADGRWHHLAATVSATRATLYVDGQPVAAKRPRGARHDRVDTPVLIGGGSNVPGVVRERLDGTIDETAIYDRALAPREIAALAAGAQPR
jgi:hypothetical protein